MKAKCCKCGEYDERWRVGWGGLVYCPRCWKPLDLNARRARDVPAHGPGLIQRGLERKCTVRGVMMLTWWSKL